MYDYKKSTHPMDNLPVPGLDIGENSETVINPYSGASCVLKPDAVAAYEVISEQRSINITTTTMRRCLDWFRKYYLDEYMILLDEEGK